MSSPTAATFLAEGDAVRLVPGDGPITAERITVDYPTLLDDLDAR